MNKKINELKQKGFKNIVIFFIEFFVLSSVFSSTMNTGNLYSFINETIPFITKEMILSGSLSLIVLSTSIRTVYARYLNTKIGILEKEIDNSREIQSKIFEDDNKIENRKGYHKNLCYHYVDCNQTKKKLIKVYKKRQS